MSVRDDFWKAEHAHLTPESRGRGKIKNCLKCGMPTRMRRERKPFCYICKIDLILYYEGKYSSGKNSDPKFF